MTGATRLFDGHASTPKRSRPSETKTGPISKKQLERMTKAKLVAHILYLQPQVMFSLELSKTSSATPESSEEDLRRKVCKTRCIMMDGILRQMKVSQSPYSDGFCTNSLMLT